MVKKIIHYFLFSLIILSLLSCNRNHWKVQDAASFLPFEQFLFVKKHQVLQVCSKELCSSRSFDFSASAFIVDRIEEGSLAITAAHVCIDEEVRPIGNEEIKSISKYKLISFQGEEYNAKVLAHIKDVDICMMFVKGLVDIEPIQLAREAPKIGDKIYNIAAPMGVFAPGMVSVLEGKFGGNNPSNSCALYSLPVAGGSSGSMILNYKGRLIGIVHSVFRDFHHITLGTKYEDTIAFIKSKIKYFKTYRKNMELLKLPNLFQIKKED